MFAPMLLQKSDLPFEDEKFITELKLDGIRLILAKFNNKTRLYTRHGNEVTSRFPELLKVDIPEGTVLDGELIVPDDLGRPDFEAMMQRFQSSKNTHKIQYAVFDIIYYNGQKLTLPLIDRKQLLDDILADTETIVKVKWMLGNAPAYFELIKQHDLEGLVQKSVSSKYQVNKRSKEWLKVINYKYREAFITGLRKDEFGLLLGIEESGRIKPAGIMEFMQPAAKKELYKVYRDLIVSEDKKFIYLKPDLKCKVKFRNYTKSGMLRIPSFIEYIS